MMIKKCLAAMLAVTFLAASQLAQAANSKHRYGTEGQR